MASATAPAEPTTTAAATPPTNGAVVLSTAADGRVAVATADAGRYAEVVRRAADFDRTGTPPAAFPDRFARDFLWPVRRWCEPRADRVAACYVPPPAGSLEVFVLGSAPVYDPDLGGQAADLGAELFAAGWRAVVVYFPMPDADNLRAYFDPDDSLAAYAQQQPAPVQGEE